jgi:hypothetical protein
VLYSIREVPMAKRVQSHSNALEVRLPAQQLSGLLSSHFQSADLYGQLLACHDDR